MFLKLVTIAFALLGSGVSALPRHRETLEEAGKFALAGLYLERKGSDLIAVNVKKLVHSVSAGTMASVFPDDGLNAGTSYNLSLKPLEDFCTDI